VTSRTPATPPGSRGLLSVRELGSGFAAGAFTPLDVLGEVLGRARDLHAISVVDEDGALAQARASTGRAGR